MSTHHHPASGLVGSPEYRAPAPYAARRLLGQPTMPAKDRPTQVTTKRSQQEKRVSKELSVSRGDEQSHRTAPDCNTPRIPACHLRPRRTCLKPRHEAQGSQHSSPTTATAKIKRPCVGHRSSRKFKHADARKAKDPAQLENRLNWKPPS